MPENGKRTFEHIKVISDGVVLIRDTETGMLFEAVMLVPITFMPEDETERQSLAVCNYVCTGVDNE